jgi:4-amino-4-deoxy-L-arabinose transferase-like glycosyltransferase
VTVQELSRRATARALVGPRRIDLRLALSWLLISTSVAYGLAFLAAAYFRLTYPYPLWVMEAPSVQAVRRILSGQALYGPPTLDYVPTLYAPLYFYVSALAAAMLGPSLLTLRLVSLLASIGSTLLIGHLVWRETRNHLAAITAAGVFVCSTALAENSFDHARVDALSIFFILASLDVARAADLAESRRAGWLSLASGVLVGAAVLSKQTAGVMLVALAGHVALSRDWRRIGGFVVGAGLSLGLAAAILVAQSGAWPEMYLVELPRQHSLDPRRLEAFWSRSLLPAFTLPLVALPVFLLGRWPEGDRAAVRFWLLAALGGLGMAWGASLNLWSGENVQLPAYAVLSAGFGLGFAEAQRRIGGPFRGYLLVLALAEFACIHYNPRASSPLRSDVEAGQREVAAIRALPGAVYVPEFTELAYQAGKGEQAFGLSIGELQGVFGGRPRPESTPWTDAYALALDQRRYDAVLLERDSVLFFILDATKDHGYVNIGPLIPPGDEFYRLDSHLLPGLEVWVPREKAGR